MPPCILSICVFPVYCTWMRKYLMLIPTVTDGLNSITATPFISIIIVNYNGMPFLPRCLESIQKQTYSRYETIIIDNNSTDASVDFLKKPDFRLTLLENSSNDGFARANNKAAACAQGEYLFFLNNDTWLDHACLGRLAAQAQDRPDAILAPMQKDYEGRTVLNCGKSVDILAYPYPESLTAKPIFYADGAALFISKHIFITLGMFDEDTFFACEDLALCWNARLRGYHIVPVPESIVFHKGGGALQGGNIGNEKYTTTLHRRYLGERNNQANILIHYKVTTLVWILPLYIIINACEILLFLLMCKPSIALNCYIKAWSHTFTMRRSIVKKHKNVQALRTVSDASILAIMGIVPAKFMVFLKTGIPRFKT